MAQWVKCLPHKCEDPSSDPQSGCNGEYLSSRGSYCKVGRGNRRILGSLWLDSLSVILKLLFLVIKHHEQTTQGGKSLFHIIQFHRIVHHQGKSGQECKHSKNLEAGTEARAVEEGC